MKVDIAKKYFFSSEEAKDHEQLLMKIMKSVLDFFHSSPRKKIHSNLSLPDLEKIFSEIELPKTGTSFEEVYQTAVDQVLEHSVQVTNPYFVGHMTGGIPVFAFAVELLTAALNQNLVKIETALSASFVELQTICWLHRSFYQRDDEFYQATIHAPHVALGTVTSGGTVGNLTALTVARNKRFPTAWDDGWHEALSQEGFSRAVIVCSERTHYSVKKIASILGLGGKNVIKIPVCPFKNTINLERLEQTLDDLANQNVCVLALVGVAGSTETGSIDDLKALATIAKARHIWFHVDAAWGGALVLNPRTRPLFDGISEADSVVLDGHKLFYLPLDHGVTLFKDEHALDAIRHKANYILREGSVDLGRTSLEGSRRFNSFKLWFALKVLGEEGYSELLNRSLDLAIAAKNLIEAQPNFEVTSELATNILTYRYIPKKWVRPMTLYREALVKKVTASADAFSPELFFAANECLNRVNIDLQKQQRQDGKSFVSRTTLESVTPGVETVVLRLVLFNPLTTSTILKEIIEEQDILGARIMQSEWANLEAILPKDLRQKFPPF